jgi:hypothetical protein
MLSDCDMDIQGFKHTCNNCSIEFEYSSMSGNEMHDEDFEGHLIRWISMQCPNCGEPNKLYSL